MLNSICPDMLVTVIQFYTCIFTYTITTVYITLNPTHMHRNQPRGYVDFWFWVVWPIAWFDYLTLEIVRREANKLWTTAEKLVATRQCMPVFMKMRCETIHWARDRPRAVTYAYLRCSFLVLSALPRLRQLGQACETTNGRSCLLTTYIYGHKTCGIWPMTACNFNLWHGTMPDKPIHQRMSGKYSSNVGVTSC